MALATGIDLQKLCAADQLCAGSKAGVKASVHAMRDTAARAIGSGTKFLQMVIAHVDRRYSVACKFEFLNLMSPDADRPRCGKSMRRSHPHLLAVRSAFEKLPGLVLDA